jgi:hypothetical protein
LIFVFLGFVFLVADLFPVGREFGGAVVNLIDLGTNNLDTNFAFQYYLTALLSYVPAVIANAIFFKKYALQGGVAHTISGSRPLSIGALLMLFSLTVPFAISSAFSGDSVSAYLVTELVKLLVWPAKVLLVVGAVRFLTSLRSSAENAA